MSNCNEHEQQSSGTNTDNDITYGYKKAIKEIISSKPPFQKTVVNLVSDLQSMREIAQERRVTRAMTRQTDGNMVDIEDPDVIIKKNHTRRLTEPYADSMDEDSDSLDGFIAKDNIDPDFDYDPSRFHNSSVTDVLRQELVMSNLNDELKTHCNTLLAQYDSDPSNYCTSLEAAQYIMKLKTGENNHANLPNLDDHDSVVKYLNEAWEYMEQSIYGQLEPKQHIIEYLVTKILNTQGSARHVNSVLGLIGPPGVGKTSMVINGISHVLGLPFHQLSVGGLRDVTYLNGSARYWKGAHPGIFAKILMDKGTPCVVYIDELDKVAEETANDIYGYLTHALDPVTNNSMLDHFLSIELDLSQIIFIVSYNDPDKIPAPLRDRIKEVVLSDFTSKDRVELVKNYVLPELLNQYGLNGKLIFKDELIQFANKELERKYPDITGVRTHKRMYQSLIDKILVRIVADREGFSQLTHAHTHAHTQKSKIKIHKESKTVVRFLPYSLPILSLPYTVTYTDVRKAITG